MIDLNEIVLQSGAHDSAAAGMCIMEMVSYMADEPWSDHPACVSPVLGALLLSWNDGLDEETRQLLKPYAARVIGTANDGKDEARAWMATDWLCRTQLPAWLDLAGLKEHAAAVRALGVIASTDSARAGQPTLAAAWAAAQAAAGAAVWAALKPTVTALQASAFDLLDRMIAL